MSDDTLRQHSRNLIQEDVGNRGLRTDPDANLITACADDFAAACRSIAEHAGTRPSASSPASSFRRANPPCGETDGPLGAVFLARALTPLGIRVVLLTDAFCASALWQRASAWRGLRKSVLGGDAAARRVSSTHSRRRPTGRLRRATGPLTHLIALERVGPSHTPESLGQRSRPSLDAVSRTKCRRNITTAATPCAAATSPTTWPGPSAVRGRARKRPASSPSASATAATRSAWARSPGT